MKHYSIKAQQWYQSAEMVIKENCEKTFEVTEEQKEYMEDHLNEVKKVLNYPYTIDFEPFWNGEEDAYFCTAYYRD